MFRSLEVRYQFEARKRRSRNLEKRDLSRSERYYGNFCRSIQLPSGLDLKHVRVDLKNGLLSVVLPKTAEHIRTVPITPPRMHWE